MLLGFKQRFLLHFPQSIEEIMRNRIGMTNDRVQDPGLWDEYRWERSPCPAEEEERGNKKREERGKRGHGGLLG